MGLDKPPVFDRDNLPGLRAAQVVFDGYGWRIERDKDSLAYKLWNKEELALHELCHIRYFDLTHESMSSCVTTYRTRRKWLEKKSTKSSPKGT